MRIDDPLQHHQPSPERLDESHPCVEQRIAEIEDPVSANWSDKEGKNCKEWP
jgi:hypothetical protein